MSNTLQSLLLQSIRALLRPLARFCIRHGLTYPMLLEEIKTAFVEVADQEFQLDGKPQTDSRITVLTGVHRKDVHRIRTQVSADRLVKPTLASLVASRWLGQAQYLDPMGNPLPLSKTLADGGALSFEALVAGISKDVRSKPLLDEWLNQGIVEVQEDGKVALSEKAFVPQDNFEQRLQFMTMNVHDHLSTAVHNLNTPQAPWFERCAFTDDLTAEQVHTIHNLVRTEGMQFLKRINAEHVRMAESPAAGQGQRVNVGVYFYTDAKDTNP